MKSYANTRIFIVLIMCFNNIARADLDFFSRLYLSNKKYEKYMTVRSAVVAEDEVMNFFNSISFPAEQKKNRELYGKKLFLIVQCKNIGEFQAFGEMQFKIEGGNLWIPVYCTTLYGNMQDFSNCAIICIGSGIVPDNDNRLDIIFRWKNLYTY